MSNSLADALATRRFCYVVELVATGLRREAQLLEVASRLATLPDVVAGSITSYAGGAMGHDPLRVGTAARARGLTPNIHLTCVNGDRQALRKTLEDLHALGIQNVFALTGDFPRAQAGTGPAEAAFDLDSVQLVRLIAEMRRAGMPFHVAVAVSPFKYVEADCMYQYLKLEKKIAAGADLAITQVGWDAEKLANTDRQVPRAEGILAALSQFGKDLSGVLAGLDTPARPSSPYFCRGQRRKGSSILRRALVEACGARHGTACSIARHPTQRRGGELCVLAGTPPSVVIHPLDQSVDRQGFEHTRDHLRGLVERQASFQLWEDSFSTEEGPI